MNLIKPGQRFAKGTAADNTNDLTELLLITMQQISVKLKTAINWQTTGILTGRKKGKLYEVQVTPFVSVYISWFDFEA